MKQLLSILIGNGVAGMVLGMTLLYSVDGRAQSLQQMPIHWRPVLFDQRVYWVGAQEPTTNDLAEITALIKAFAESKPDAGSGLIEQYVKANPESGWIPSLENFLAEYDMVHGQFTPALELWRSVWQETKQYADGQEGKRVADYALAHWTRLLASLGRYDTLTAVFSETKGRVLDRGPLSQLFLGTKEAYVEMGNNPGISYRCGTWAMLNVCHALYGTNFGIRALMKIPSPTNGFTLERLEEISEQLHLGLVKAKLPVSAKLIVPSVVNWKQHHYGAIIAFRNGLYEVVDPTMEQTRMMTAGEINAEASGYYLVPSTLLNSDCLTVPSGEAAAIYGKGNPYIMRDSDDQPCQTCPCPIGLGPGGFGGLGGGGLGGFGGPPNRCSLCVTSSGSTDSTGVGMPQWSVSEPYINLWLQDEPLAYQPAYGPKVSFRIYYKDRVFSSGAHSMMGANWSCDWLQPVVQYGSIYAYLPGGGYSLLKTADTVTNNTFNDYYNNTRMTTTINTGGSLIHAEVQTPDGGKNIYDARTNGGTYYTQFLYLSQQMDSQGKTLTFQYDDTSAPYTSVLTNIVDATGLSTTLGWETDSHGNYYLTNVTDPFGRSVSIQYSSSYVATNITDVAGNSSAMSYEGAYGMLTNLITPYGATSFYRPSLEDGENVERAVLVTEPTGGKHLYYYNEASTWLDYPDSAVPTNTPFGTLDTGTDLKNSYYWGPRQYPLLPAGFRSSLDFSAFNTLTTNDLLNARIRHWLGLSLPPGSHPVNATDTISLEQEPSPDGVTLGMATWYDYPNKAESDWSGDQILPGVTARVMPDGSTSYTWDQRDVWGHLTNEITHWWANGQDQFRTNSYVYSTNGFDLLRVIAADGVTSAAYGYDNYHRVLFMTNALGEVTRYTYNTNEQLTSTTQPNGLITTNLYGSDNFLATQIVTGYSTNVFSYSHALVYSHIDERGLATTNTWDALNRLTSTWFPDGTCISNQYKFLDITGTKDRLGNWTHYGYDALRHKIAETNALGAITLYSYCICGSLDSIKDAMGDFTYFYYDNQGNLTNTIYAGGYSVGRTVDLLHRIISSRDSGGYCVTNTYNNHGLLVAVSNAFGRVQGMVYDVLDRVTNSIDANGVSVTNAYDYLSRIRARGYPDGGVEKWGYTLNISGATSYTNQIGNVVLYGYDAMNHKTNEVTVGVTTNRFAYNGAGDLLALTDGKTDTTTWIYDTFGRVTNKVDAAGNLLFVYKYDPDNRLTNRASLAKGSTSYTYDAVGNLKHITYPVSPSITLSYDKLNRLTNMVDAVGATVYGYDAAGQLLSEDGPWANDTVSYTYNNRLRTGLSLQAPNASAWTQSYGYDSARRLTSVSSPAGTFGYVYGAPSTASALVDAITLPNGAFITNHYDGNARLLSTILKSSGGTNLDYQSYAYNQGNQRTAETNLAGDFRNYTYDNEGELISAVGKEPGGTTNRLMEQFGYAYDAAGNLNWRTNNALVQNFAVNNLNELSMVTRNGTLTVAGTTTSVATNVTVNSLTAALYGDATFAKDSFALVNGTTNFTAIAKDGYGRRATNTVTVDLRATNSFAYDLNGNLLTNGTMVLDWDDENELIRVTQPGAWKTEFTYDGKLRRRIRREFTWSGSWVQTNEVHYIWDGNVVVQERDANNLPLVTYTRGNDLSGTSQGAGGIGGLLARTDNSKLLISDPFANAFYHADGNGNITAMIFPNQTMAAKYLYGPFGSILSMSGPLAPANTIRFSSMEYYEKADMLLYVYRPYFVNLQRWGNRDPNQEWGGMNLYGFDENDPDDFIDPDGAKPTNPPPANPKPPADPCAKEKRAADRALHDQELACAGCVMFIEGGPADLPIAGMCAWATYRFNQAVNEENDCRKAHRKPPSAPTPKPPNPPKK